MTLKVLRILLCISILLNIFDIVLHVAINQPELLRITGNIFIIIGSGITLFRPSQRVALVVGLLCYLVLNGVFIALHGIGSAGMVFIAVTTLLTIVSSFLQRIK